MAAVSWVTKALRRELERGKRLIGVAVGSGLMAKCCVAGQADMILLLTSSIFREMGRSSLAGYFPYGNSNAMVMDFGLQEVLPRVKDVPVIFGLCANDPTIRLENYIEEIKKQGFHGINNYPSVGLIDGDFRRSIEEAGMGYENEVRAIKIAHDKKLFTVAFVFDTEQTQKMLDAGADVICVQLGLTRGGSGGAKRSLALEQGIKLTNEIFDVCGDRCIKMVYGGPVATPLDLAYVYEKTGAHGYIGGSSFGRIPAEEFYTNRTIEFKNAGQGLSNENMDLHMVDSKSHVDRAAEYIAENYSKQISFADMADELHLSRSYLSSLFKRSIGSTFPEYLARYRIARAMELMESDGLSLEEISVRTGFGSYSYFAKTFKNFTGKTPSEARNQTKISNKSSNKADKF